LLLLFTDTNLAYKKYKASRESAQVNMFFNSLNPSQAAAQQMLLLQGSPFFSNPNPQQMLIPNQWNNSSSFFNNP